MRIALVVIGVVVAANRDRLAGIVLTHGHEDHIGAVPYVWPRLRCPIYATPFTAQLVRRKLADAELIDEVELIGVEADGTRVLANGAPAAEDARLVHVLRVDRGVVLRARGRRVIEDGPDLMFYTNPVRVTVETG